MKVRRAAADVFGRPWFLPILLPVIVGLLAVFDGAGGPLPSLPVFRQTDSARDALGLLWQVEGAILALVVAALLFVFEGLTRSRPDVSVWVYAQRSGLTRFLMLGAAGVLAVPVALFWSAGRPPLAAAHVAFFVGISGLVGLPFLFFTASRIISPAWLREQQLADVRAAVGDFVEMDAVARAARAELDAWVDPAVARSTTRLHAGLEPLEVARGRSTVYDIIVPRLIGQSARAGGQLLVLCRLGESVSTETALISSRVRPTAFAGRPICVLTSDVGRDRLKKVIRQLRDEAAEVIRTESVAGIESVADAYVELWLAWPKMRALYQSLALSAVEDRDPFKRSEIDDVIRHLRSLIIASSERRLESHCVVLTGVILKVGREAYRYGATDVVRSVGVLAWSLLGKPQETNLQDLVNNRACTFQIELCRFVYGRDIRDDKLPLDARQRAADSISAIYHSLARSLHALASLGEWDLFDRVDRDYAKDLDHWNLDGDRDDYEELVLRADEWNVPPDELSRARASLKIHDLRDRLQLEREGYRLSILAWILRSRSTAAGTDTRMEQSTTRLVRSLGSRVAGVIEATGVAIQDDHDLLSEWITFQLPPGEFAFIDSDRPLLHAFATVLMAGTGLRELSAPWLTEEKAQTLKGAVRDVSTSEPDLRILEMTQATANEAADRIMSLIDGAVTDNREREDARLVAQQLDRSKVDEFRSAVVEGWSDARLLPDLLTLTETPLRGLSIDEWDDQRLGIRQLLPKGLFVTPSSWAGIDHLGRSLGEGIAYGEIEAVLEVLAAVAPEQPGNAAPNDLLNDAIDALHDMEYEPRVIFVPPDYELIRSLGLPPWQPADPTHGKLGVHVKGSIRGIPVIEWRKPPKDIVIVADLKEAVRITQGVDESGETLLPATDIDHIDDRQAREIIAQDPDRDEPFEDRLRRLLTSVGSFARIPYRVEATDAQAIRLIRLERDRPESADTDTSGDVVS